MTIEKPFNRMSDILKGLALDEVTRSIIMVAGVGGAGGNALNHMVELGINDVTFMACNTDAQALENSRAAIKVQLGAGLGAGNDPEIGSQAAKESVDDIINVLKSEGTRMIFIAAGMGGGTGTGASPIVAKAAQELGILTVAIVTTPFTDEGPVRNEQAREGIAELRQYTDSLLVLSNDSIEEQYGELPYDEGFGKADDVLATGVKGIAEIITGHGKVNVDFADVYKVMKGSGRAFMGSGRAGGDTRAEDALKISVTSLLLNHKDIKGAKNILLNISHGAHTVTQSEARYIRQNLQEKTGGSANLIWGTALKPQLEDDELELTIVATGFPGNVDDIVAVPGAVETPYTGGFVRPAAVEPVGGRQEERLSERFAAEAAAREEQQRLAGRTEERYATAAAREDRLGARETRPINTPPLSPKAVTPSQPQSGTVQWKGKDRYSDIDQLVSTPAWVRRRARLTNPYENRGTKTALNNPDKDPGTGGEGSLFE